MSNTAVDQGPIHELLRKRWSPRAFADRPVEPAVLQRLLEAGRWAPSSFNEQPWALLVATREQPEQFQRLLSCLVEFNQSWARSAPVLMLSVAHKNLERNGNPNAHAWHDVGAAMANLTFQATAEGLFVHQMAGILPDRARQECRIPDDWDPVAGVALGYLGDPASLPEPLRQRETAPRQRKPLTSFVFGSLWQNPLSQPS
jgi:nitroreductase